MLEDPDREAGPRVPGRSLAEVEYAAAARRRTAWAASLGLLALAAGVLLVMAVARDSVTQMWPSTARLYQAFHLTEKPGAGLVITVASQRTTDTLLVTGNIVNRGAAERPVPRLRVALRDAGNAELDVRFLDPPAETLQPGAGAPFTTVFEHPAMTAAGVAVTFADDR